MPSFSLWYFFPALWVVACTPSPKESQTPEDTQSPQDTQSPKESPPEDTEPAPDIDGDGYPAGDDCDDTNRAIHPGAQEVCGGGDEDCDGLIDEADDSLSGTLLHADADGDGHGDPNAPKCVEGPGIVVDNTDYDDQDPEVWNPPDTWMGDLTSEFSAFCVGYRQRYLHGTLDIGHATQAEVNSLDCIVSIEGTLVSKHNNAITSLDGLTGLAYVGEEVSLYDNTTLVSLDGLSNLAEVGQRISIDNNPLLTNVAGFSALTTVGTYLYIGDNPSLSNLDGLHQLTTVALDVFIVNNDTLTSVDGLSSLTSLGENLEIFGNPALCDSAVDALLSQLIANGYAGMTSFYGNKSGC